MSYVPPDDAGSLDFDLQSAYTPPSDGGSVDFRLEPTNPEGALSASLGLAGAFSAETFYGKLTTSLAFFSSFQGEQHPHGAISGVLSFSAELEATTEVSQGDISAALGLSAAFLGYEDWISRLPPLQIQETYRLVVTGANDGLDDLHIGGISSWQATNQAGSRSSYLQAVIPAAELVLPDLELRPNGQLIIEKGYRLSSGETRYEEILRSGFDTLRPDRGGRALTVTVSGYLAGKAESSGYRVLTGIRSISAPNGKRRVRCDIDLFLRPGMTVDALGEIFRADYINYYVSQTDKFCEVGER